ncbi:hypothetical protein [Labrys miyagiensis]|nr:hypothetical protein [Labrys miyagiensis]
MTRDLPMTEVRVDTWGPERPQGGGGSAANLGWLAMVGVLYALGTTIPLYGIDPQAGFAAMTSVGMDAGTRLSIFGLGLMPLFMPLAFLELAKLFIPRLARWQVASAPNMFRLNDYVRFAAFAAAALQGYGIATAMEQMPGVVPDPGAGFIVATMSTYVGSTALLAWLADRISLRGFGNGFWLLWIVPFVNVLPFRSLQLLELARTGAMSPAVLPACLGLLLISGVVIVVANLATVDGILPRDGRVPAPSLAWRARLTTQVLIWPPLLANIVIGVIVAPLYLLLSGSGMAPGWLHYGSGGHIFLFSVLTLFLAYAYAREAPNWRPDIAEVFGSETEPKGLPAPFWLFGLMQVALCTSWELLASHSPMDFLAGSSLITVVTVVMNFIRPWRLRLS